MDWLWAVVGFALGSLPFAVWIGKYGMGKDIRQYGDGNPGAFNVLRAGGFGWGGLAIMLDISKGALPMGLAAQVYQIEGLPLIAAALAPPLGHAFSPLLNFRGGKAIATMFGVWIGLSLWQIPVIGAIALVVWYTLLTSSGWAVMFTLITMLIYMILSQSPGLWFIVWAFLGLLLVWKHRIELIQLPRFKWI